MTPQERRALLGDDMVEHVRNEARAAAVDCPPGPEVIAALRPILTSRTKQATKKQPTHTRMPLAA